MKPCKLYMNVSTNIGDPAHQESTTLPFIPTSTPVNTLLRTKTLLYWTKNKHDSIRSTRFRDVYIPENIYFKLMPRRSWLIHTESECEKV